MQLPLKANTSQLYYGRGAMYLNYKKKSLGQICLILMYFLGFTIVLAYISHILIKNF